MCIQCDRRKEQFDELCMKAAEKLMHHEFQRAFGTSDPSDTQAWAAMLRSGHFVSALAADRLKLSHLQRWLMVIDFKHTVMQHPGLIWDCPPCFEEYINIAKDDESEHCHH